MRTDPRFYHPDTAEGRAAYIAEAEALLTEIRGRQGELFGRLPTKEVVIRPVEAWRERSAPKASYTNPPQDGSRPGKLLGGVFDGLIQQGGERTALGPDRALQLGMLRPQRVQLVGQFQGG